MALDNVLAGTVDFGGGGRLYSVNAEFHHKTEEQYMKYLCLVYVDEKVLTAMDKPERQSVSDESEKDCTASNRCPQAVQAYW